MTDDIRDARQMMLPLASVLAICAAVIVGYNSMLDRVDLAIEEKVEPIMHMAEKHEVVPYHTGMTEWVEGRLAGVEQANQKRQDLILTELREIKARLLELERSQ